MSYQFIFDGDQFIVYNVLAFLAFPHLSQKIHIFNIQPLVPLRQSLYLMDQCLSRQFRYFKARHA
jgi:hypothetical protein